MKLEYVKVMLAAVWVLAMLVVAYTAGVSTVSGQVVLVGVTLLLPLLMWWFWKDPTQTMSESIDQARR